jgi:hypothetical protein
MAANSQRRRLGGKARRALELLVDQQGSTEAYLGFTDRMLFLLAQAGLITIRHEIINTGTDLIEYRPGRDYGRWTTGTRRRDRA